MARTLDGDERPPRGCVALLVAVAIVVLVVVYLIGLAYLGRG